jgi:hypothetical protein
MARRHITFLRSRLGACIRSPNSAARVIDIKRKDYTLDVQYIRGSKAYWGFGGFDDNWPLGPTPSGPVFTHKVFSPTVQTGTSPNIFAGGTDDCASDYGPPTGYDVIGGGYTGWDSADQAMTVTGRTRTVMSGTILDYLGNPVSVTSTISNLRPNGYSKASSIAAAGSWTDAAMGSPPAGIRATCDEFGVTTNPLSGDPWKPKCSVASFGGPYTGNASAFASEGTGWAGGSGIQNALMNPGSNPGSGWYLTRQSGAFVPGAMIAQRGRFRPTTIPVFYWFGELRVKSIVVGDAWSAAFESILRIIPGGGEAAVGTWVEVPGPSITPADAFPYFEAITVVFCNQLPIDVVSDSTNYPNLYGFTLA